eukprot:c54132_g1_i1 orf=73-387(+)
MPKEHSLSPSWNHRQFQVYKLQKMMYFFHSFTPLLDDHTRLFRFSIECYTRPVLSSIEHSSRRYSEYPANCSWNARKEEDFHTHSRQETGLGSLIQGSYEFSWL